MGSETAEYWQGERGVRAGAREGPVRRSLRRVLTVAFDVSVQASHEVEVRGLEHYTREPPTLIVATHRRDTDGPLLCSALIGRHGPLPHFVAREDLFRRGFLREYLTGWPRPLRELLGVIDVAPVLELLHAHPMRRIPERTLWETLEDVLGVCGDLPLSEVLLPRWSAEFQRLAPRCSGGLCVRDALGRRYRPLLRLRYGLSKLTRERFRAIKEHERRVIEAQLGHFVALLDRGESVQLEPEGTVSTDGGFHRLRNGLYALLTRPRCAPRVLPVGITYDFMRTGCQRVFVNVGPELVGLEELPRREVNARVARAIRALTTVTVSQLASRYLLQSVRGAAGRGISAEAMEVFVECQAVRWKGAGLHVDPRALDPRARGRRVRGYLRYCVRHGALARRRGGVYLLRSDPPVRSGPAPAAVHPLHYVENELSGVARCTADAAAGA